MPDTAAHVWLVEAAEEDAYIKAHVLATLPVGDVRRLSAVLAPQRYHLLCAQAALRQLAAAFVGSTPLMVGTERGRDGKPRLGGVGGAHLSLAHSGRFAAVALCTAGPVGVDVELPRAPSDSAGLARTILSGARIRPVAGTRRTGRRTGTAAQLDAQGGGAQGAGHRTGRGRPRGLHPAGRTRPAGARIAAARRGRTGRVDSARPVRRVRAADRGGRRGPWRSDPPTPDPAARPAARTRPRRTDDGRSLIM